jgi:hypothetical protein
MEQPEASADCTRHRSTTCLAAHLRQSSAARKPPRRAAEEEGEEGEEKGQGGEEEDVEAGVTREGGKVTSRHDR